jgi:hypothetical protein
MRNVGKLAVVVAVALTGIGAWMLPASAATLAVDFNGPTNYTSETAANADKGTTVEAYGYEFTAGSNESVTALGTFDNGSVSNLANGGQTNGDTVSLYSGTIGSNSSAQSLTPLASVTIEGTNASTGTVTQNGAWAFLGLTSPVALTSGDSYFILTYYGDVNTDPVAEFPSTVTTNSVTLTLGLAEICGAPATNCNLQSSGDSPGIFGPDFETAATPLPAALPLFAGGLGLLGFLGRGKKRKAPAAVEVA